MTLPQQGSVGQTIANQEAPANLSHSLIVDSAKATLETHNLFAPEVLQTAIVHLLHEQGEAGLTVLREREQ